MIATALFFAIGFVCGLFLRFISFAVVLAATLLTYIVTLLGAGRTGVIFATVLALLALQVGYFMAVVYRVSLGRWRAEHAPSIRAMASEEFAKRRSPITAGDIREPMH